ncbi:hypothetical protein WJX73_005981 [Symbiochloris irregularis]|uniref:Uncharacterized protein n=1 Tax=Symbiochloris irregularis TaxID=706552 RepID=A0AAW1NZ95_9CHLO
MPSPTKRASQLPDRLAKRKARPYHETEESTQGEEEPSEQQCSEDEQPATDDHSSVLFFKHPTSVRMRNREAQARCLAPKSAITDLTACLTAQRCTCRH